MTQQDMTVSIIEFEDYSSSVANALDEIQADDVFKKQKQVLIKPNLICADPHPITTPKECCKAIVEYIRSCSDADICIAEGCGDADLDTHQVFDALGYTRMAEQLDIELIDLNEAPTVEKSNPSCPFFSQMILPEIAYTHFVLSVPVLKAHSLAQITGTLKNMMGFAPPTHYSGEFGIWKKAVFHENMQQSIMDLNQYVTPDMTVMDATIGLCEYHLGGPPCSPPVNKVLAGMDPVQLDRVAADLLGLDWQNIAHLK